MKKYEPMYKLQKCRESANLTRAELAEKANITYMSVLNYERGVRFPKRDILGQLALALNCEISDIV